MMPSTCLRLRAVTVVTTLLLLAATLVTVAAPSSATGSETAPVTVSARSARSAAGSTLCTGYVSCARQGYSHGGYASAGRTMWWRMYAGHNCTNYVAYRMVRSGLPNERPWSGSGNATNWGVAREDLVDAVPRVGAVAWWRAGTPGGGRVGHVAYVERVVSATEIVVSQDSWGGDFSWARLDRSDRGWPTGFLHFNDVLLRSTGRPVVSGTPEVGEVLTASPGRWSVEPSAVRYRWRAGGRALPDATGPSLGLGPGLLGKRLTVVVTATRQGYRSARSTSAATSAVTPGTVTVSRRPGVVGSPRPGGLLRVEPGVFRPADASVSVSWWRGDTRAGAGPSYRAGVADLGARLVVQTRVTRRGYAPLTTRTPVPSTVREDARLRVRTTTRGYRTRVLASVTAAHVAPVTGRVVVRWQGRAPRSKALAGGRAELTLRAPRSGPRRLSVRYTGSADVAPTDLSRRVHRR